MRTGHYLAATLFASASLFGCARLAGTDAAGRASPSYGTFGTPEEARRIALTAGAECEPGRPCDPSIAYLVTTAGASIDECTAFVVASDVIATNSHCVPSDLRHAGASCDGRIWANFPEVTGARPESALPASRADCAEVLAASGIGDESEDVRDARPDYALLRMKSDVKRPTLAVAVAIAGGDALADDAELALDKADPMLGRGRPFGQIRRASCRVRLATLARPESGAEGSSVVALADCSASHGNSGSPLLDANGRARAILQSLVYLQTLQRLQDRFKAATGIEGPRATAPLYLATNLACVSAPGTPLAADGPCAEPARPVRRPSRDGITEAQRAHRRQTFERFGRAALATAHRGTDALDPRFGWRMTGLPANGETERAFAVPVCIRADARAAFAKATDLTIDLPVWTVGSTLDESLRLVPDFHREPRALRGRVRESAGGPELSAAIDGGAETILAPPGSLKACPGRR